MALMCSGGTKKSHFYSMPPLHRAAAKDGEKAAKSCPCRAVGAGEAAAPQILAHQLTLSHPWHRANYALLRVFRPTYGSVWPAELLWNPLFEFLLNA